MMLEHIVLEQKDCHPGLQVHNLEQLQADNLVQLEDNLDLRLDLELLGSLVLEDMKE